MKMTESTNDVLNEEIKNIELSIKKIESNTKVFNDQTIKYNLGTIICSTFVFGYAMGCILTHRW